MVLPLSILGTFGPMYLLGYSIDNLSLMALTIATGFVVDDAVVVLENIVRHLEAGPAARARRRCAAAPRSSFTVISMSLSLIAVFIPILLMPGIVGLLFHEFAVTLSIAILFSLVISLTITPTMCAYLLAQRARRCIPRRAGRCGPRRSSSASRQCLFALAHRGAGPCAARGPGADRPDRASTSFLFRLLPSTFFPEQDNGLLNRPDHRRPEHFLPGDGEEARSSCRTIVQQRSGGASVVGFTGTPRAATPPSLRRA